MIYLAGFLGDDAICVILLVNVRIKRDGEVVLSIDTNGNEGYAEHILASTKSHFGGYASDCLRINVNQGALNRCLNLQIVLLFTNHQIQTDQVILEVASVIEADDILCTVAPTVGQILQLHGTVAAREVFKSAVSTGVDTGLAVILIGMTVSAIIASLRRLTAQAMHDPNSLLRTGRTASVLPIFNVVIPPMIGIIGVNLICSFAIGIGANGSANRLAIIILALGPGGYLVLFIVVRIHLYEHDRTPFTVFLCLQQVLLMIPLFEIIAVDIVGVVVIAIDTRLILVAVAEGFISVNVLAFDHAAILAGVNLFPYASAVFRIHGLFGLTCKRMRDLAGCVRVLPHAVILARLAVKSEIIDQMIVAVALIIGCGIIQNQITEAASLGIGYRTGIDLSVIPISGLLVVIPVGFHRIEVTLCGNLQILALAAGAGVNVCYRIANSTVLLVKINDINRVFAIDIMSGSPSFLTFDLRFTFRAIGHTVNAVLTSLAFFGKLVFHNMTPVQLDLFFGNNVTFGVDVLADRVAVVTLRGIGVLE